MWPKELQQLPAGYLLDYLSRYLSEGPRLCQFRGGGAELILLFQLVQPKSKCMKSNILTSCIQTGLRQLLGFSAFRTLPKPCPPTTFPRTEIQGPIVKAGHPYLLPKSLAKDTKRQKGVA